MPKHVDPDEIPGAPAITALPPGFASLQKATRVEIRDEWNGMGPTHDIHARLVRNGTVFDVRAKVGSY